VNIAQFNYLEAVIWLLCGLSLLLSAAVQGRKNLYFIPQSVAGLTFLLFSISDLIEAQTGAWWRPLGLLVLKMACVVVFIGCYYQYRKIKKLG
jgi:hypothetical protein